MRYVRGFFRFWYDFVVGDDWRMAAGVAIALVAAWALARAGVAAWWLLPLAAMSLLWLSLVRAAPSGRRR